jgi:hypothetical protein
MFQVTHVKCVYIYLFFIFHFNIAPIPGMNSGHDDLVLASFSMITFGFGVCVCVFMYIDRTYLLTSLITICVMRVACVHQ